MNRLANWLALAAAASVTLTFAQLPAAFATPAPETVLTQTKATENSQREVFNVRSSDGTNLVVEAKGDPNAPEILFIHGLRQSSLSWDKQFDDPSLAGFRLVRFDLRGHGDSDKPSSTSAYSDPKFWADDVAAVIKGAGLRRAVLVGWSLGGYVAGAYLHEYGDSAISGVNLVDAVIKLSPDLLTPLAGDFTKTTTSHDLAVRTEATADFLQACFNLQPTKEEFDNMLVVNGMTARAVNEGFIKTPLTDLEPTFKSFSGSILLTHGVHDRLVRQEMSERIKALRPDSELQLYDDSGHSPFFEEPARYGRDLAAFARKAAGS